MEWVAAVFCLLCVIMNYWMTNVVINRHIDRISKTNKLYLEEMKRVNAKFTQDVNDTLEQGFDV